jgi:serine/threonine-protein kinase
MLGTAIYLAWKHVKSGSADRKGAFKIGLAVLLLTFTGIYLSTNHVPAFFPELDRFFNALREGLRNAAFTWLLYMALEPIVRRNWPELVVSWNRLLAGDWRDPLVGRDVLIGALGGALHFSLIFLAKTGERFFYNDDSILPFPVNGSLSGFRFAIASELSRAGGGIWAGFMFVGCLIILFLIFRRRLFAGLAFFTILCTIEILFFAHSLVYLPITILVSILMSVLNYRFGLVTMVTAMFVFFSIQYTLFTSNFSAWYAGSMFLTIFLILTLLVYGFRTSLAGKSLFGPGPLTR